jgi:homoserine dehydrogenase
MAAQAIRVDYSPVPDIPPAKLALLGSGTVGLAVLRRLSDWRGTPFGRRLNLVFAANTRLSLHNPEGLDPERCAAALAKAPRSDRRVTSRQVLAALGASGIRVLIDATADPEVAANHPALLDAGVHVATACKLARGTSLSLWREVEMASRRRGSGFGDRATVGAGLPLLQTLRELQDGGDRIHAIAGVMSGSLAWLFDRFDGSIPFSALVREAHARGYTEPDPRDDLSGEDVRRKILIMARTAGFPLESECVEVESLVPEKIGRLTSAAALQKLELLDAPLHAKLELARREGGILRFVARLKDGCASVGVESLRADDPLSGGRGTDNRVAIWSDRYETQPLIIQGPGAGAHVTAAALLDDALKLSDRARVGRRPSVIQQFPEIGNSALQARF